MSTALGVIGFIVIVLVVHWMRVTAQDVVARGLDGAISKVRSTGPTSWAITAGSAPVEDLMTAVRGAGRATDFGRTSFSISTRAGQRVLLCSTPAGANLLAVRTAVLEQVRQVDSDCQLQL